MANLDLHLPFGEGLNRNEPIMVGSSDEEEDNIEHRRTRRLGGARGTPIPRRILPRGMRVFSPAPALPAPPLPFNILHAIPFLEEIGHGELMRMLIAERANIPRAVPLFARTRQPEPPQEPEPYDVRMTHASARPRLGFTFDFEQPEEEEKPAAAAVPKRVREPVKYKQTIEIPDSPPMRAEDAKGKGKAKVEVVEIDDEMVLDRNKEIIEIYSDDEEAAVSMPSSSQQPPPPPTKITSVLICAGCRRPLRTGGDRLWALRCGHMIDSRCYTSLSHPQPPLPPPVPPKLIDRIGDIAGPSSKRRKTNKEKGKGKTQSVMETHEWMCPVKDCGKVHKSERMVGEDEWVPAKEDEWVPAKEDGAIKVFI